MLKTIRFLLFTFLIAPSCFATAVNADVCNIQTIISQSNSERISLLSQFDQDQLISSLTQEILIDGLGQGASVVMEPDFPMLPALIRVVVVPPAKGLELSVTFSDPVCVPTETLPPFCPPELLSSEIDDSSPDLDANGAPSGIFPSVVAEMSEPFIMRGVRMVRITAYPVRYDFENQQYLLYNNLQTSLEYTDTEPVNPVIFADRQNRSPQFLKFIRDFAINGDQVGRDDPDRDEELEYLGHYLVVTHEQCLPYLVDFIEWRRKSGWKVDVLNLTENDAFNYAQALARVQEAYNAYAQNGLDPFDHIMLVGDLPSYLDHPPAPAWILGTYGNSHCDWYYGCLEGNDEYADVAVSRWCAGNADLLQLFSHRTLTYEMTPAENGSDWMGRAAVYAQRWARNYHVSLHTNARWGRQALESKNFDEVDSYENMVDHDSGGNLVGPFIRDRYNEGCSIMIGRAENYYFRNALQGVNDNDVYPIDMYLGGHQEHGCWNLMRSGTMEHPKGAVASTCAWGNPQTLHMSITWLEQSSGILMHDLTFGWARIKGVVGPTLYIPNYFQTAAYVRRDLQYYGDPGIQQWNGVPEEVRASFKNQIVRDEHYLEVQVSDERGNPVSGAQVTFYVPGEMPEAGDRVNDDPYAAYDEMFMVTKQSDADGFVDFFLDEELEWEGDQAFVTVTGREIIPFLGNLQIVDQIEEIKFAGYEVHEIEGNEDEDLNPGEIIELPIRAQNTSGENVFNNVTALVTSNSPWIEIIEGELEYGDLPAGEDVLPRTPVRLAIHPACPDGEVRPSTRPLLRVEFQSGEQTFKSVFQLTVHAPNFTLHRILGGDQVSGRARNIEVYIRNIGSVESPPMQARIEEVDVGVNIIFAETFYDPIGVNRYRRGAGEPFRVVGNNLAVPGSWHKIRMILTSEAGFIDTTYFSLQVGEEDDGGPVGPDDYGYICFDDTDDSWDAAPDFDWVEICSRDQDWDFRGQEVDFERRSPFDIGEVSTIRLPFRTQFYGQIYDHITIATNGFISMGEQEWVTNFQNWPLDRALGGGIGMLAPLWDNLELPDRGGIYTYYDEEQARFIIEWYRMQHRFGNGSDLTFQVILYNRDIWITETGDQNILFQYLTVTDQPGEAGAWTATVPYASVGISSPAGTTGLNYCYNNAYPPASAQLANRRALLFTTAPRFRSGILFGEVTDFATGQPVEGACITTQHGFSATSNEDGEWVIDEALAGVEFEIVCTAQGYNDSTLTNLQVEEEDSLELNFSLLHPEFVPSEESVSAELQVDEEVNLDFTVTNTGTGPLLWSTEKRLRGEDNLSPWELREQIPVGEIIGDTRVQGAVFLHDHFYVAAANDRDPQIYIINREGELIGQFGQFIEDQYGIRDLTYDGEWLWGSGGEFVYAFTPDGELMREFEGPWNPNHNFAWDDDRGVLWISSTTSDLVSIDRDGNIIQRHSRQGLRMYGISYYPQDADGYGLYLFHRDNEVGEQLITKMNPETGDTLFVTILEPEQGGAPIGCETSNSYDIYNWVYLSVINNAGEDRIDIWQLDARQDWFDIAPTTGVINPDEIQEFTITLNANSLPIDEQFDADLVFHHNADDGVFVLPVTVEVIGGRRSIELELRADWNLCSFNITPINNDLPQIMTPLVEAGILLMVKDFQGRFFLPEMNFNNIPGWNAAEGYKLCLSEPAQLHVVGDLIQPDTPLSLLEGWNMISYYPRVSASPQEALAGIENELIIAKNGFGQFYLPDFDYCNLPIMAETYGYQIKVRANTQLIYNVGAGDDEFLATVERAQQNVSWHYPIPATSETEMSVLLLGCKDYANLEVAAVSTSDQVLGRGRFDATGRCGLSVGPSQDQAAEILSFRLWDGTAEQLIEITPVLGQPSWEDDGILVAEIANLVDLPVQFGFRNAFPNPANGPVTLLFGIDEPGLTHFTVFDIGGRVVQTFDRNYPAGGNYTLTWQTDLVASGVYLVRMNTGTRMSKMKLTVVK